MDHMLNIKKSTQVRNHISAKNVERASIGVDIYIDIKEFTEMSNHMHLGNPRRASVRLEIYISIKEPTQVGNHINTWNVERNSVSIDLSSHFRTHAGEKSYASIMESPAARMIYNGSSLSPNHMK